MSHCICDLFYWLILFLCAHSVEPIGLYDVVCILPLLLWHKKLVSMYWILCFALHILPSSPFVILSKILTIWPNINSDSYFRILRCHYWPHYKIRYFSPLFNLISNQIVAQDEGEKKPNSTIAHTIVMRKVPMEFFRVYNLFKLLAWK